MMLPASDARIDLKYCFQTEAQPVKYKPMWAKSTLNQTSNHLSIVFQNNFQVLSTTNDVYQVFSDGITADISRQEISRMYL